jgi:hypothetical protein
LDIEQRLVGQDFSRALTCGGRLGDPQQIHDAGDVDGAASDADRVHSPGEVGHAVSTRWLSYERDGLAGRQDVAAVDLGEPCIGQSEPDRVSVSVDLHNAGVVENRGHPWSAPATSPTTMTGTPCPARAE